jgi:hypothetical protein
MNWKQIEREEQAIEDAYARGEITNAQYQREMRELRRDIREAAEEEATNAYFDSMEVNGFW